MVLLRLMRVRLRAAAALRQLFHYSVPDQARSTILFFGAAFCPIFGFRFHTKERSLLIRYLKLIFGEGDAPRTECLRKLNSAFYSCYITESASTRPSASGWMRLAATTPSANFDPALAC